jgi:RNA polymerase sigma-70 factor (ECF subfamily)
MDALLRCDRRDFYLLTIARNYCRDALRRNRPENAPAEQLDLQPDGGEPPVDAIEHIELHGELRRAVAALPDAQRELVALRMSAGLTFQEIADLLQIPLATALSRMHAALQRLRSTLGAAV